MVRLHLPAQRVPRAPLEQRGLLDLLVQLELSVLLVPLVHREMLGLPALRVLSEPRAPLAHLVLRVTRVRLVLQGLRVPLARRVTLEL